LEILCQTIQETKFMNSFFASFYRRFAVSLFLLIQLTLQGTAQTTNGLSDAEQKLVKDISVAAITKDVTTLSSDAMEGRGTMQPGGDKAAAWIAGQMKAYGLKPLGDNGTYLQAVPFIETTIAESTSLRVDGNPLALGKDWSPVASNLKENQYSGGLVFAGHAIVSDAWKRNDIKDADLKDKIVVVIQGRLTNIAQEEWDKANAAALAVASVFKSGAKGLIYVANGLERRPPEMAIDFNSRRQIQTKIAEGQAPPPVLFVSTAAAEKLFAKSGISFKEALAQAEREDFKPIDLKTTAEVKTKPRIIKGTASNVVGYIEGSDPVLKSEAVFFTAHYDAYGVLNGKIYNGAADNALGTAEMLAAAKAFSKMKVKPKRSLVFLSVTGEEYGLLGSKHWLANPTWDLQKIAGLMNLDGIGTEIFGAVKNMVGFGAQYSTLGPMLEEVAKAYGISLMPDPLPEEGIFRRSDHYPFVEKGIPALMLMGAPEGSKEALVKRIREWMMVNYHQPSDDIYATWYWEGAKTVADIMAIMGLRVAEQQQMPAWVSDSPYANLKRGTQ
jgi:Zn-dependent M28 family amino/carboxypeptidase